MKSNSDVRWWTPTAVECYQSNCNCSECKLIDGLESVNKENCCVKTAVSQLVKKYGVPEEKEADSESRDFG